MISPDLSSIERHAGCLRLFYPAEDRMLFIAPLDVLTLSSLASMFELTPNEERLVREKAQRLIEIEQQ